VKEIRVNYPPQKAIRDPTTCHEKNSKTLLFLKADAKISTFTSLKKSFQNFFTKTSLTPLPKYYQFTSTIPIFKKQVQK
jgi:hypothetical protein